MDRCEIIDKKDYEKEIENVNHDFKAIDICFGYEPNEAIARIIYDDYGCTYHNEFPESTIFADNAMLYGDTIEFLDMSNDMVGNLILKDNYILKVHRE